ncbi:MAG: DNA polymerase IV [Candidatus Cloacimonetes bacterium]|nr:DNA polymerase IV [Candidatus Cloacimonadota bacterium]
MIRKIIHVDMDAFFAAVYIRDHPEVKGKPVICGGPANSRGVVSTCNYEARKYGIHSAMPSFQAHKLCPHGIFVKPDFDRIREAAEIIREIFHEYTNLVEPVSIDEAYLDVTMNLKNIPSATLIAKDIKQRIRDKTKLTASAGVSYNKFLAKIGSDLEKPDGLVVIPPEKAREILLNLPIGKFHGIGKVSEKKMISLGIRNGADLKKCSLKELVRHFGKSGKYYYDIVRGRDKREVCVNHIRKSIGMERTFAVDLDDPEEMLKHLKDQCQRMGKKLSEKGIKAKTITLKVKFANFDQITRNLSFGEAFNDEKVFYYFIRKLLLDNIVSRCKVRLLGICFSNLEWEKEELVRQMNFDFYEIYPAFKD